jgi:hypothetical protein
MIRIAVSSLLTLALAATVNIAADTTPYLVTAMLVTAGFAAGAFVMFATTFSADSKGAE